MTGARTIPLGFVILCFLALLAAESISSQRIFESPSAQTDADADTETDMLPHSFLVYTAAATMAVAGFADAQIYSANATATTYTNPILDMVGADPWVIREGDYYYMTFTTNTNITLYRSKSVTDWNTATTKLLFSPPPNQPYSTDIWAPEIHYLSGLWYVIFTADPNYDTPPPQDTMYCTFDCPALYHRMYVLESSGSDIWNSSYELKGELDTFDMFAIDGTYLQYEGELYHVYSCWYTAYESWPSNLCITKMSNPYTISSNLTSRTIISVPTEPWERTPYGRTSNIRLSSNEGPESLISPITGQLFLIYSAARSDNPNYCLGQLALTPGGDPMNAADWTKSPGCVFYQDKRTEAYGVGHASFVETKEKEWWVVYHGMRDPVGGWEARTIRTQKFSWGNDGRPVFPRPGYGPFEVPKGEV